MQLIDQINDKFANNCFSLGIFIDLSKAFDTVNHQIIISKFSKYGVNGEKLSSFKSYLQNRKQYLNYNNDVTSLARIKCSVPQRSILGPLLFLIYVNNLCNASIILNPIIFSDDTNLFWSHQNINTLFKIFNEELIKIGDSFKANKLSLNNRKTKYTIFYKKSSKNDLPQKLPALKIAHNNIEGKAVIKFLWVMLGKNIAWEQHIYIVETKLATIIGVLYHTKAITVKKIS